MSESAQRGNEKGRAMRPFSLAASVVLALAVTAACATPSTRVAQSRPAIPVPVPPQDQGRLAAPVLACDRNHLTVWPGRVTGYTRRKDSTWLRIATDDDTVESTTLRHPGDATATRYYRLNGAPFTAADFARIERKPGKLRPGMRARAWICEDGVTPPVIDWQPPAG